MNCSFLMAALRCVSFLARVFVSKGPIIQTMRYSC